MGRHQDGTSGRCQRAEQLDDRLGGDRVDRSRRFVGQDDPPLPDDRPCDGDALLLATGDLAGEGYGDRQVEADLLERLAGRPIGVTLVGAVEHERKADVAEDVERVDEVEPLQDDPHHSPPHRRPPCRGLQPDRRALEAEVARAERHDAADRLHERRLARRRRADHGHHLSGVDREVHAPQRFDPALTLLVPTRRLEQRHGGRRPRLSRRSCLPRPLDPLVAEVEPSQLGLGSHCQGVRRHAPSRVVPFLFMRRSLGQAQRPEPLQQTLTLGVDDASAPRRARPRRRRGGPAS